MFTGCLVSAYRSLRFSVLRRGAPPVLHGEEVGKEVRGLVLRSDPPMGSSSVCTPPHHCFLSERSEGSRGRRIRLGHGTLPCGTSMTQGSNFPPLTKGQMALAATRAGCAQSSNSPGPSE